MNCPQGWICSDECFYYVKFDKSCTYMEEERVNLQQIADKIEKQDYEQTMKDAELIKARNESEEGLTEHEKFWRDWGKYSPPNYNEREPINAMSGAIEFGGGSKSGKKHKVVKKNNPFDYLRAES